MNKLYYETNVGVHTFTFVSLRSRIPVHLFTLYTGTRINDSLKYLFSYPTMSISLINCNTIFEVNL